MNLDQLRAQDAFAFVQRVREPKDFLGVVRSLPAMLQTNGLLATWAHLLSKKGAELDVTKALLDHLQNVGLVTQQGTTPRTILTEFWVAPGNLLASGELRRLTREATVYSVWLKRAAEALCEAPAPPAETPPAATAQGAQTAQEEAG